MSVFYQVFLGLALWALVLPRVSPEAPTAEGAVPGEGELVEGGCGPLQGTTQALSCWGEGSHFIEFFASAGRSEVSTLCSSVTE